MRTATAATPGMVLEIRVAGNLLPDPRWVKTPSTWDAEIPTGSFGRYSWFSRGLAKSEARFAEPLLRRESEARPEEDDGGGETGASCRD